MTPIDYNNPNDPWRHNGYDPYKGLSDDERMKAGCFQAVSIVGTIIVALLICALLGSCTTTKYVPMPEYHTDTVRIVQHQRDSIYLKDSTHVSEKGDTVRIEHWHTEWRDRWNRDTVYQATHDTIPQPYPVIKEVEKKLSRRQQMVMSVGSMAIMAALIWFLWWAVKILRRYGILKI